MEQVFNGLLSYAVNSTSLLIRRRIHQAFLTHDIDVTFEQWRLLVILYQQPGIIQAELAARTDKDRTNITRILDVMTRNGYVERRSMPEDRRCCQVFLTDAGKAMTERLVPIVHIVNDEICQNLTTKQLDTLLQLLSQLQTCLAGDERRERNEKNGERKRENI